MKETYGRFKEICPNLTIGFSSFASLRPKNCVLAGASGTHLVCVCLIHQNMKLMLMASKTKLTYKELLKKIVCDDSPGTDVIDSDIYVMNVNCHLKFILSNGFLLIVAI